MYRAPIAISCYGDDCIATEIVFSPSIGNTNHILASKDGGVTWTTIASNIPQWDFEGTSKKGLYYGAVQQIDSLRGIIGSSVSGFLVTTFDGWKTWKVDSTYHEGIALSSSVREIKFSNAAEGMLFQGFGFFWSTVDSGKTWKRLITYSGSGFAAYGDSTFRIFEAPDRLYTTRNNWITRDTSRIQLSGPLADTSFHAQEFVFGRGDSVA
ncbi:MAG TPA: hypothetical protein VFH43_06025, partial [Candidatus Kapabacteria bacterium]|nr:hypothetical protein [Candidatus Kapabacteria bacterium]